MSMIIPDFLLFTFYAVQNAYLPLFLRNLGYTASEIGFLYSVFNIAGLALPLLLTSYVAKKKAYTFSLFMMGLIVTLVPIPMFKITGFVWTAIAMALYASGYKMVIPVTDSVITQELGDNKERYGFIRVWGSIGFVVMALIMQKFCDVDTVSNNGMILWMSVPAALFTFSIALRSLIVHSSTKTKVMETSSSENEKSTFDILRGFGLPFFLMMMVVFFEFFGMIPANNFLSLYVTEQLGINSAGFLWALSSACEIPFMFLSVILIKRFGEERLILFCTLMVTVRNLVYAFVPNMYGACIGQALHSLTYGAFFPAGVMYCSKIAGGKIKGTLLATTMYNSFYGLASVIGAAIGGVVVDTMGYFALFIGFGFCPVVAVLLYFIAKKVGLTSKK